MEPIEVVRNTIKSLNESTNKELLISLEYLNNDFEQTKSSIINLTKHLDNTEIVYNKILEEYKKRTNG
jgi:hypothetical protein